MATTYCQPVARQPFRESFTALAGEKVSFFDAAILIFSPFDGLRPSRSGESLVLNFPNPANETSSPATAALTMLCSMSSRIACACVFVTQWAAAVILIVVLTFFFVKDGGRLWDWILELFHEDRQPVLREVGDRSWTALSAYVQGVFLVATIVFFLGRLIQFGGAIDQYCWFQREDKQPKKATQNFA